MEGEQGSGNGGEGKREVEIGCPSCRKVVAVPLPASDDFACPRCRCELGVLASIVSDAAALLREARLALVSGDTARALDAAAGSWELRQTRAAASIAFVAATLQGDAPTGVAWLRSSRKLAV